MEFPRHRIAGIAIVLALIFPAGIHAAATTSDIGSGFSFSRNLRLWERNEDIRSLQQFLNELGYLVAQRGGGSPGNESTLFGLHTLQALVKFQTARGLPATGYFGPLTRAIAAEIARAPISNQYIGAKGNVSTSAGTAQAATTSTTIAIAPTAPNTSIPQLFALTGSAGFGGGGADTIPPTITLSGANPFTVAQGSTFTDPGASASDNIDGTVGVSVSGSVNVATVGAYTLTYNAVDRAGNRATATRIVSVTDQTAPVISAVVATAIATSTETISWSTNEAATSTINYGLTSAYGIASSSAAFVTSHSITLTGLTANTTYNMQVSSTDTAGNVATSTNQTFTTVAYDYYVDSISGSDANSGRTPTLALQNLTALPTPLSNVSICLVANSYWRQFYNASNGATSANLTIAGCGSGAQPVVDASDAISTSQWSQTGGLSATYQTGSTLLFPTGVPMTQGVPWVQVFENGNYLAYYSTTANVDAHPGSYTVNSMSGATGQIFVHASDNSNPATNGKTYEYTSRPSGIYVNASASPVVRNIHFKRAGTSFGALQISGDGTNALVDSVTIDQGNEHSIGMPTGILQNSTFNDEYIPAAFGTGRELI
jgi:hypothetical protein